MQRLEHYKAKLKAAKAEETIRVREYNIARRALHKVINEIVFLEEKVKYETNKLERASR